MLAFLPITGLLSSLATPALNRRCAAMAASPTATANAAAAAGPAVLATETAPAVAVGYAAGAFLGGRPRGAYTTARTYKRGSVFEYGTHVARFADTVARMDDGAACGELADAALLRPRMDAVVGAAIEAFGKAHPDVPADAELKLCVHAAVAKGAQLECHASLLPETPVRDPQRGIVVEMRSGPRENALAKDSTWVNDRQGLEALKGEGVNEIVLYVERRRARDAYCATASCATMPRARVLLPLLLIRDSPSNPLPRYNATDAAQGVFEGTMTNFYAIDKNGAVHTAGEGILLGTVRRLLLEVCAREGIEVVLEAPSLRDAEAWQGCIVSSTSRLALPVDELVVPAEGERAKAGDRRLVFDNDAAGSVARRLQRLVENEVASHSERPGAQ